MNGMKGVKFESEIITRTNNISYVHKPRNVKELKTFFSKKKNQEALFVASPSLYREYVKWVNNESSDQKHIKLIDSLNKYATRMTCRCTPFGLFSGVSTTKWDSQGNYNVVHSKIARKTRLDASFLFSLIDYIESSTELEQLINYYPNNTIYTIGDKYRYVDYKYKNGVREYNISSVDFLSYIEVILVNGKKGANLYELSKLLIDDDITFDEAFSFCKSLRDEKLLISEFDISITKNHTIEEIITKLSRIKTKKAVDIVNTLGKVLISLNEIDNSISNDVNVYYKISTLLKQIGFSFSEKSLFQVDYSYDNADVLYPKNIQKKILNVLHTLGMIYNNTNEFYLPEFKKRFYERYGDEEVSMLKALDNESGIGYLSKPIGSSDFKPYIEDLVTNRNGIRDSITWDKTQAFLLTKLIENNGSYQVSLTKSEIESFMGRSTVEDKMNDTFSCLFSVVSDDENGCKIWLKDFVGGSASKLINRFSHIDKNTKKLLQKITEIEEKSSLDVIKAEVIHLPQNRTGNVLFHPPFMKYEIPYLSNSSVEENNQIHPKDLMISIVNDEVILRSKKLNRRVVPFLNTAHNYSGNDSLPVYHFLCDLATQKKHTSLYFTWGMFQDEFSFLPRVEIDGVIVSPAKWNIKQEELSIFKDEGNFQQNFEKFISLKNIPQKFYITQSDNLLLIDILNELDILTLKCLFKKSKYIQLTEYLFDDNNMFIKNDKNEFLYNESIAILSNENSEPYLVPQINEIEKKYQLQKNRRLDWIFLKIYAGVKSSENILTDIIRPLAEELFKCKLIKKWFFIRYSDPHFHLRVRFHVEDKYQVQKYIDQYFENSLIYEFCNNIQIEEYKPEIKRYGVNTLDKAEYIFFQDSLSIVNILSLIEGKEGEKIKILNSVYVINQYLDSLNYSLHKKLDFVSWHKEAFYQEFGVEKELRKKLSARYKELFPSMDKFIKKTEDYIETYDCIYQILDQRNEVVDSVIKELIELNKSGYLNINIEDLLSSYIHMFVNRMFRSNQRKHEMLIYSILFQYYRTKKAIQQQEMLRVG